MAQPYETIDQATLSTGAHALPTPPTQALPSYTSPTPTGARNDHEHRRAGTLQQRRRTSSYLPPALIRRVYEAATDFAENTYDPQAPKGSERVAGGLLVFLVDGDRVGINKPRIDSGEPDFTTNGEHYLGTPAYAGGIAVVPKHRPDGSVIEESLDELLLDIATEPRAHDLAILVDHNGYVLSTSAHVEGVRKYLVHEAVSREGGNARHTAAAYGTKANPYWVAITVSASDGKVRLWQDGEVLERYDPETGEHELEMERDLVADREGNVHYFP